MKQKIINWAKTRNVNIVDLIVTSSSVLIEIEKKDRWDNGIAEHEELKALIKWGIADIRLFSKKIRFYFTKPSWLS